MIVTHSLQPDFMLSSSTAVISSCRPSSTQRVQQQSESDLCSMHLLQLGFMLSDGLLVVGGCQPCHLMLGSCNSMGLLQHVQLVLRMLNALEPPQLILQSSQMALSTSTSLASCWVAACLESAAGSHVSKGLLMVGSSQKQGLASPVGQPQWHFALV